jgi:hypothetical protein
MYSDKNSYKLKYLKYKKKYLDLKMTGGANCAKFGFNQHSGECWNDSLSMIFCYCDGIGENIQEIFKTVESFSHFINHIDIKISNGIPLEFLPPNYNLNNIEDKEMLLDLSKAYIIQLYERYSNEQKVNVTEMTIKRITTLTDKEKDIIILFINKDNIDNKIFNEYSLRLFYSFLNNKSTYDNTHEDYNWYINNMTHLLKKTGLLNVKPSGLFRQNSVDFSIQCIDNILNISNHNSAIPIYGNSGRKNEYYITMCIISYFLLNYPIENIKQYHKSKSTDDIDDLKPRLERSLSIDFDTRKPELVKKIPQKLLKYLSFKDFTLKQLFTKTTTIKYIIDTLNDMKNYIYNSNCILINSYADLEDKKGTITKDTIYEATVNHSQCFFICETQPYFYDDNGIIINGIKKQFIKFNWKSYLINIVDNIIKTIREDNKDKIYNDFSKFYYDTLRYSPDRLSMIKNLIFIKNQNYEPQLFKLHLIQKLESDVVFYNTNTILDYIINIEIDETNVLYFYNIFKSSFYNNEDVAKELLKKDKVEECFTIKSSSFGDTLLHDVIYMGRSKPELVTLLLSHPKIYLCFNIQNNEGYTPLHLAISRANLDIIKQLLQKSEIYNSFITRDKYGNTPLLFAIKNIDSFNKIEIIKELIGHVRISDCYSIADDENNTPIKLALDTLKLDITLFKNK